MSNSPEHVIHLLQRLPTNAARDALASIKYPALKEQIEFVEFLEQFIESVAFIQAKVSPKIPALLKGNDDPLCGKTPT